MEVDTSLSQITDTDYEGDFAEQRKLIKRKKTDTNLDDKTQNKTLITAQTKDVDMFKLKKRRIQDESDPKITHPSGKNTNNKTVTTTDVINKYTKLTDKTTLAEDMAKEPDTQNKNDKTEDIVKIPRPPPIVIHGQFDGIARINKHLKDNLTGSFHWRNSPNSTGLYLANKPDWETCKTMLQDNNVNYHTFSLKEDKTHAFVLRGLFHEAETTDIKEELTAQQIKVKEVFRMKGTRFPAYLVVTSSDFTVRKMENIKFIQYTKVRWERHHNNKFIIQCHRCQAWGHATANCHSTPKCLKCAASHITRDCIKDTSSPAKCANCGAAHPANNTACPVYQKKLNDIENNRLVAPDPKMKFVAAPPPRRNAWIGARDRVDNPLSNQDFPPLRTTPRGNQTTLPTVTRPELSSTLPTHTSIEGQMKQYSAIQSEFTKLNELIDLDLMLSRIRALISQLMVCQSEAEKFEVFYNFMSSLSNV